MFRENKIYSKVINSINDGVVIIDAKIEKIVDINKSMLSMTGYKKAEVLGKPGNIFTPKKLLRKQKENINKLKKGEGGINEIALVSKNGTEIPAEINSSKLRIEKNLYFIRVFRDLRKAKKAKKLGESIFNSIPDLMFVLGKDGTFLEYLSSPKKELYIDSKKFIGKKIQNILPKNVAEISLDAIRKSLKTGKVELFEYDLPMKNETRTYEARISKISESEALGLVRDITKEKERQKDIGKLKNILENSQAIIFSINKDGIFTLSEGESLSSLGLKPGEAVGKSAYEMYKDYPEIIKGIKTALRGEKYTDSIVVKGKSGEVYFDIFYSPEKNDNGKITEVVGMAVDTTEIKKAEEKSRQYLEIVNSMIVALNNKGNITLANEKALEILGYGHENELLGKNWFNTFVPKEHLKEIRNVFNKLINGDPKSIKEFSSYENEIITKEGKVIEVAWNNTILTDYEGKITGTLSSGEEITERNRQQKIIAENERLYRSLVESTSAVAWEVDLKTLEFTYISPNVLDTFGYPVNYWKNFESWKKTIVPKDREKAASYCQRKTSEGKDHEFEYKIKKNNGDIAWVRDLVQVIKEDGKPKKLQGFMFDVTETKKSEEALINAQRLSKLGSWEWDKIKNTIIGSEIFYEILETDPDSVNTYEKYFTFLHPDDIEKTNLAVQDAMKNKKTYEIEHRIKTPSGKEKNILAKGDLKFDKEGNPVGMIGTIQDISERKHTEEELKTFKSAVESALDGIQLVDLEGKIIYSNPSVEKIYGFSAKELEGKDVNIMNADQEFAAKKIIPTLKKTGSWIGELNVKHKNGKIFPIRLSTSMIFDDGGNPIAMLGIIRDISKRKKREEETKEKTKELELFSKLTTGRELKMIELKEKVRKLEEKLKKYENFR